VLPGIKAGLIMGCTFLARAPVSYHAASASLHSQHTYHLGTAVEECMFVIFTHSNSQMVLDVYVHKQKSGWVSMTSALV